MYGLNGLQPCKMAMMLAPISVNATAATTTGVDCKGWHYATVIFITGALGATMDEVTIQGSNTSVSSGFGNLTNTDVIKQNSSATSAVTGLTFTDPVTSTNDNDIYAAYIDLRRGIISGSTDAGIRFLKPVIDPGAAASLVACICILTSPDQSASDYSERGVTETLIL